MRDTRIAVIGLYRSGSTAAAGLLHHLGVDMGAPFWGDYYEPNAISEQLRAWWNEPLLEEQVDKAERVQALREWIEQREAARGGDVGCVGCKHPLLSLCGDDLVEAWGAETRFVWTYRPLDESIASIARLNWWPRHAEQAQRTLWKATHEFFARTEHLRIEFADMLDDPRGQAERIAAYVGLQPTSEQMDAAVAFIRPRSEGPAARGAGEPTRASHPAIRSDSATSPRAEKIVATLLSGNNEEIVVDAVRSVIDWVDEVLLIDTGITDGTVELVKEVAGDKFYQTPFAWCNDFALARNTSLEAAAARGATWALTIDTDERLIVDGFQSLDEFRRLLAGEPEILAWLVSDRTGSYAKERLVRVPTEMRWKGRTHEALIGAKENQRKVLPGVRFYEVPKTPEAFRHKLERDLAILQEETRDKPDNARWWYYLGQTFDGLNRRREAADAYLQCATLDGWPEEAAWACYQAAKCLSDLTEFRLAVRACALGLARQPGSPELAWLAGFCCFQLGEFRNAIHWEQMAIALGNFEGCNAGETRIGFRHLPGWYEGPYDVLRFVYQRLGMPDAARDAEEKYQRASQMRSDRQAGKGHDGNSAAVGDSSFSPATKGPKVFFDLGSHHGESLSQFVSQLGLDETWEIHSYEPNPACGLADRLSEFDFPIHMHESAVWICDGAIGFRQQTVCDTDGNIVADGDNTHDGWGSCVEPLNSSHPGLQPAIEVPCEDFARLLEACDPDAYIVVKMDVEGAEFVILRHLIERGVINRIKRLYVEWHERLLDAETPDTRNDLERQIRDQGVEVVRWG